MADWTSQPPDGTNINPIYSSSTFLWNAIAPTKNQLNGATATSHGTSHAGGTDGTYFVFDGPTTFNMQWAITPPPTAYTLVLVLVHPTGSIDNTANIVEIPGGNFRMNPKTTGGGVYDTLTHTGVSQAANTYVTGVGGFDTNKWVYIAAYTGTTLRQYLKDGSGANGSNFSETIGYSNSGSSAINLGDGSGTTGQGLYAVMLLPYDVGDTECLALRDNPWRMFAPAGGVLLPNLERGAGRGAFRGQYAIDKATELLVPDQSLIAPRGRGRIIL
jgi:hypothetical protein